MASNKVEIRVYAMMRSGHHAVISWLRSMSKRSLFLNNIYEEHRAGKDIEYVWGSEEHDDRDFYIFNVEEARIRDVERLVSENDIFYNGHSSNVVRVVVLRNPFNMFASRLQMSRNLRAESCSHTNTHGEVSFFGKDSVRMWCQHAKECLRDTSGHGTMILPKKFVYINFDAWVLSSGYRSYIANQIGATTRQIFGSNARMRPKYGSGSSFLFGNMERPVEVVNRWRRFMYDDEYIDIFSDEEMLSLCRYLFGDRFIKIRDELIGISAWKDIF